MTDRFPTRPHSLVNLPGAGEASNQHSSYRIYESTLSSDKRSDQ